jgi:hypothetical protein
MALDQLVNGQVDCCALACDCLPIAEGASIDLPEWKDELM